MLNLPLRMRALPRYKGLPVPYFTLVQGDGIPNFRAHDGDRHKRAMEKRLCGICGQKLGYWVSFILGPNGLRERLSYMPGMHEDCAHASLELCPFLAHEEHVHRDAPVGKGNIRLAAPMPKPPRSALAKVRSYEVIYRDKRTPGMEYAYIPPPKFLVWYAYENGKLRPESLVGVSCEGSSPGPSDARAPAPSTNPFGRA